MASIKGCNATVAGTAAGVISPAVLGWVKKGGAKP